MLAAGCKSSGVQTSDEAGVFADSDQGLVLVFSPGDVPERLCATVCDGESIARAYVDRRPLDAKKQCTNVMQCVFASDLKQITAAIDACYAKADKAATLIEAVRAERIANPAAANAVAPCEAEIARLTRVLKQVPSEPIKPELVGRITTELEKSTETALTWLGAKGYLTNISSTAQLDGATTSELAHLREDIMLRTNAKATLTQYNADLAGTLSAMRGLGARMPDLLESARREMLLKRAEEQVQRVAAQEAARKELVGGEQGTSATDKRRRGPWEALRATGSWYVAPARNSSSPLATHLEFNRPLGFIYSNADFNSRKIDSSRFKPKQYTCEYDRCWGDPQEQGGWTVEPIVIDPDGRGFTMATHGNHFRG
jgi:hypothetical protein